MGRKLVFSRSKSKILWLFSQRFSFLDSGKVAKFWPQSNWKFSKMPIHEQRIKRANFNLSWKGCRLLLIFLTTSCLYSQIILLIFLTGCENPWTTAMQPKQPPGQYLLRRTLTRMSEFCFQVRKDAVYSHLLLKDTVTANQLFFRDLLITVANHRKAGVLLIVGAE